MKIENVFDVKIVNKTDNQSKWTASNFRMLWQLNNQTCINKFIEQDFFIAFEEEELIKEVRITKAKMIEEVK